MKPSSLVIIVIVVSILVQFHNLVYAQEELDYKVSTEEIGECGYIFEFMPDGNIICATLRNEKTSIAEVRVLNMQSKSFKKIYEVKVYIGKEEGEPPHERGLVGLTIDPSFNENHYVYLHYTYKDDIDANQYKKVVRLKYDMNNNTLVQDKVLIDKISANQIHNGGPLEFGPDGMLYITNGDADISPESRQRQLENPWKRGFDVLNGKILRIDRDGNIPDDNPFPNSPIYTYGHRNVFGLAFHPITGLPFITENGPETDDEINILYKGLDYGWPIRLGYAKPIIEEDKYTMYNFDTSKYINPIWSSSRPTVAPTGITFYTASRYPDFANDLFFLTLQDISLHRAELTPPYYDSIYKFYTYNLDISSIPTDIEVGHDGEIYVSAFNNKIYRIIFEPFNYSNDRKVTYLSLSIPDEIRDVSKDIMLVAKLTDNNGEPLFYKPVNFMVNGHVIATVRTDDKGDAKVKIDPEMLPAINVIRAIFLGDGEYKNSYSTKTVINVSKYSNVATFESLIYKDKIAKVSIVNVNGDSIEYGKEITFIVTLIDGKGNILDEDYTFIIMKEDGNILFLEDGNMESNIHRYSFKQDDIGKVSIIIKDRNGNEAKTTFNVIPEFSIQLVYIVFAIGLSIVFTIRKYRLLTPAHYKLTKKQQ